MIVHASSVEIISVVPNAPPLRVGAESSTSEHAHKQSEIPMPRDWQSFALTAILVLLVLVVLSVSGEVVLPILCVFLLNLLLQPAMNALTKARVPKTLAALFIIVLFIGTVTGIVFSLSGPAAEWISKAPQSIARLEERLSAITLPVAIFQKASQDVEKFAAGPGVDVTSVSLKGPGLGRMLFSGARTMVAEFATMTLLLFFLLRSGDLFLRRLVEIPPTQRQETGGGHIARNHAKHLRATSSPSR